jgi:hypothetical protein
MAFESSENTEKSQPHPSTVVNTRNVEISRMTLIMFETKRWFAGNNHMVLVISETKGQSQPIIIVVQYMSKIVE